MISVFIAKIHVSSTGYVELKNVVLKRSLRHQLLFAVDEILCQLRSITILRQIRDRGKFIIIR